MQFKNHFIMERLRDWAALKLESENFRFQDENGEWYNEYDLYGYEGYEEEVRNIPIASLRFVWAEWSWVHRNVMISTPL